MVNFVSKSIGIFASGCFVAAYETQVAFTSGVSKFQVGMQNPKKQNVQELRKGVELIRKGVEKYLEDIILGIPGGYIRTISTLKWKTIRVGQEKVKARLSEYVEGEPITVTLHSPTICYYMEKTNNKGSVFYFEWDVEAIRAKCYRSDRYLEIENSNTVELRKVKAWLEDKETNILCRSPEYKISAFREMLEPLNKPKKKYIRQVRAYVNEELKNFGASALMSYFDAEFPVRITFGREFWPASNNGEKM